MTEHRVPLRYRLNPCDIDRDPRLARLGDWLADYFDIHFRNPTHDCPCCMAVRVLLLAALSAGGGFSLALLFV